LRRIPLKSRLASIAATRPRVAAARNERIMPEQGECGVEIGLRCELNKADNGLHVMLRDKPSEAGRGNEDHWSAWSPSHARPWEVVLWATIAKREVVESEAEARSESLDE
jgi:hypothetical protein